MKEEHMAVYVIASLTVKDTVRFEDYRRTVLPTMEKYGGRLVARGGPIVLEGEWPRERLIIAEFPSMEGAQQWWVSPEYAEPKALRQATAIFASRPADPSGSPRSKKVLLDAVPPEGVELFRCR